MILRKKPQLIPSGLSEAAKIIDAMTYDSE